MKCQVLYCEECDGVLCAQCIKGYSLVNDGLGCACNALNCLICNPDDGDLCLVCVGGYDVTPDGLCECAIRNCATCSQDGRSCKACINGYRKGEGGCECLIDACKTCSPQDGQLCDECHLNYDLVHGACVGKIPGCLVASLSMKGAASFVTPIGSSFTDAASARSETAISATRMERCVFSVQMGLYCKQIIRSVHAR